MCFGGSQPQAPQIQYQGPSQADIDANQASLDQYKAQMTQQQSLFQSQLQTQIDSANKETERLKTQYDQEAGAAAAAAAAQQTGAYAVTATQSEATTAQTTAATPKKEKPKSNLRISLAGTPSSAGSGLNIGV
jgi:hypothetical protein